MSLAIDSLTLDVQDPAAADAFYQAAFGLGARVRAHGAEAVPSGFRGFSISLVVGQPSTVDALHSSAVEAGATAVKQPTKGMWGYGSVVEDQDGMVWKLATSARKEQGPATRQIDAVVLLLGAADLRASKRFYVERGLAVKRSFPGRYAEFEPAGGAVTLALYPGRAGVAKEAGVSAEGDGTHGLTAHSRAGSFIDPDGFAWEPS
ncbi:MAG: glyoxalase [Acidobacteriota bacterium]|nr:glyoxalase [Acidobacteriota bacterium]